MKKTNNMKIYRYKVLSVSGNADPYTVFNNYYEEYQGIEYFNPTKDGFYGRKDDPMKHPLDGIRINKLFSGTTIADLDGTECHFQLDANIEFISERCILLVEFVFDLNDKNTFEIFYNKLNNNLMEQKVFTWKQGEERLECTIDSTMNNFLYKNFYPIETDRELQKAYEDFDPTEKSSILQWKNKINEIAGIDPDICGVRLMINSSHDIGNNMIVDNCNFFDVHDGFEKCSDKHSVYYSNTNNDYICTNELEISNILRDFKNYLIFFYMINGYNISLQIWSTSIKKESDELITNLDSSNEVFWEDLRLKIEEWQLHFGSQNASRARALSLVHAANLLQFNSFNKKYSNQWVEVLDKKQKIMGRYIDEIKYSLKNLSIPGDTHGEQALQKTSETTNERILFLSFLAMSIPMLGAILSPDITIKIKTVSALILLSLPILYFTTTKISKRRLKRKDGIRNYKRQKEHIEQFISYNKDNIKEIEMNDNLVDEVKKESIGFEKSMLHFNQKYLDKLNKKIKLKG
jgi:hypothetical protein